MKKMRNVFTRETISSWSSIELLNWWGVILLIPLMRIPKVLGITTKVWINLLPLAPFWYLILSNEMRSRSHREKAPSTLKLILRLILFLDLIGLLLIIYIVFFFSFAEEGLVPISFLGLVMIIGLSAVMFVFVFRAWKAAGARSVCRLLLAGTIYFLFLLFAVFRTSTINPVYFIVFLKLITIVTFGLSAKTILDTAQRADKFFEAGLMGLSLYLGLNLVLYVLGMDNLTPNYEREYQAVLLSNLGIQTYRVYFPLAEGINAFGMVSGLGVTLNGLVVWDEITGTSIKPERFLPAGLGFLAGVICVLMTDSRSALLFCGTAIILLLVIKQRQITWIAAVLLGLQIVFVMAAPDLDQLLPSGGALVRKNTDLLSGRPFIWEQAQKRLIPFELQHLFGYGFYGQTISGVVESYSHLFESYRNQSQISLHHYLLQTVFDTGYVGAAAALFLFAAFGTRVSSLKIEKANKRKWKLQGGMLVYVILMGTVSVVPSLYAQEIFTMLVLAWADLVLPGTGAA